MAAIPGISLIPKKMPASLNAICCKSQSLTTQKTGNYLVSLNQILRAHALSIDTVGNPVIPAGNPAHQTKTAGFAKRRCRVRTRRLGIESYGRCNDYQEFNQRKFFHGIDSLLLNKKEASLNCAGEHLSSRPPC